MNTDQGYSVTQKMTSTDGTHLKIISYGEAQCKAQAALNKNFATSNGKKIVEIKETMEFMYTHAYIYIQIYTKIYAFMCQSNESEKSRSFLSATTILTMKRIRNI